MSTNQITLERLDELVTAVINPPPKSRIDSIIAGFKLLMILAYLWARKRILDEMYSPEAIQLRNQKYIQEELLKQASEVAKL